MVELQTRRRAPEMKLGAESVLTFAGIVVNAGLAFVITWLIARFLGASATGAFFLFTSLFMIGTSAVALGADTGLVRSLSRARATDAPELLRPAVRAALLPVVLVGVVISSALILLAEPIASWLAPGEGATPTVRVLAAALLPAALTGILLGGSRGLGRVRTYTAVQNLFIPIGRLALVAAAIALIRSTQSVVWAWAAPLFCAAAIAGFLLAGQLRAEAPYSAAPTRPERREIFRQFWSFSLPRGGAVILERALDWADVLLVIALLGPRAGGIYGVVTRIVQAGNMLESALRIVLGPRLSAAIAKGDNDAAARMYLQVTQLLILGSWPFYLAVALFADTLLNLFGAEFASGAVSLVILASAMALKNTAGALQTVLLMAGHSSWQLRNKAMQLVVLLALTLILVPHWGLAGAAIAFAAGILVDTLLAGYQVHRLLRISFSPRAAARAASLPALVVAGGSLLVRLLADGHGTVVHLGGLGLTLALYALAVLGAHKRGVLACDG